MCVKNFRQKSYSKVVVVVAVMAFGCVVLDVAWAVASRLSGGTMELYNAYEKDVVIDRSRSMYPSMLFSRKMSAGDSHVVNRVGSAFYGYVLSGRFRIASQHGDLVAVVGAGAYYVINNHVDINCEDAGVIVLIERLGYQAMQQVGLVERKGRLSYIDDCSDSLLCAPARAGDPCLNHLHFPPGILQAQHTHPTIRLGVIARGRGKVWGPGYEQDLLTGDVFCLEEGERHSFKTDQDTMDVIAYHPDSDWGPTDGQHPMLVSSALRSRSGL
ncbi:MAG: AraC family ligand binding domain-containing protein, partial [Leptospiraceae bacterium]|nr:AraC family ligand binding domain-containing protein [Leptospiraceae bacterium]